MKGAERLGYWIANNPILIIAVALLLTIASFHYAQQIVSQGMTTESMVGKDSPLYQLYDHLFVEKFGTESIAVLIEGDGLTKPETLRAMLRLSDKMKIAPNVIGVNSVADVVADTEKRETGVRDVPAQERINEILASPQNIQAINAMMPDARHTMLSISMPVTLTETQLGRALYRDKCPGQGGRFSAWCGRHRHRQTRPDGVHNEVDERVHGPNHGLSGASHDRRTAAHLQACEMAASAHSGRLSGSYLDLWSHGILAHTLHHGVNVSISCAHWDRHRLCNSIPQQDR